MCIIINLVLYRTRNLEARKKCFYPWIDYSLLYKLYKLKLVDIVSRQNKINTYACKIDDQYTSLAPTGRGHWGYQRYTEQHRQKSSEDINIWGKLYRSILGKYMYTSLELALQTGALMAYPISNLRASHPQRIRSSENKKIVP